jgi:hypothetical protein
LKCYRVQRLAGTKLPVKANGTRPAWFGWHCGQAQGSPVSVGRIPGLDQEPGRTGRDADHQMVKQRHEPAPPMTLGNMRELRASLTFNLLLRLSPATGTLLLIKGISRPFN